VSELKRRRRADAERNRATVLNAAIRLLGSRPGASTEEIAAEAGVARQTVYAHFASREALIDAVVARVTAEVLDALDAVDVDRDAAITALGRWLDACWVLLERYPLLLNATIPPTTPEHDRDRHLPITDRLAVLIRRGQREGDLDAGMPVEWLVAAIIGLGHAAGQEVAAGRMPADEAGRAFRESVLRLCRRPGLAGT
jgi:AcrR family transcriptional regulator